MKIGVYTHCLRIGFYEGIDAASKMGADGVQIFYNAETEYSAEETAYIREFIKVRGMECAAVCGQMKNFSDAEANKEKLPRMKKVIEFAKAVGAPVVTAHVGVIPADKSSAQYYVVKEALDYIGAEAAKNGVTFAIETGPEDTQTMRFCLDDITRGVGINYDPANLVMRGFSADGADAVEPVASAIVHVHAKDGVPATGDEPAHETPIGQGNVNFRAWIAALRAGGYDGYVTVEREQGDSRVEDCAAAVIYLRRFI